MSLPGRSLQQHGRYAMVRKKKTNVLDHSLLAGVVAILIFCGTFLLLHFLSRSYHRNASQSDFNSEKRPQSEFQESGPCRRICYTNECIKTAADILQMLDPTADPCQDFYRYACGGYNGVPTEHRTRDIYAWVVEDKAVKLFRELIKKIPKSIPEDTPGSSLTKIRKFYDSCIDTATSERNAVRTAIRYLEHFGIKDWPELPSTFIFSDPDLDEVLVRMALYKQRPFFEVRPQVFRLENETGTGIPFELHPDFEMKISMAYRYVSIFHEEHVVEEEKMTQIKEILEYFIPNSTARSEILTNVLTFDFALYNLIKRTNEREERCSGNSTSECPDDVMHDCSQKGHKERDRWCKLAEEILDRSGFLKKNSPMPLLLEDKEHFQELSLFIDSANQRTIAHALAIQFFLENAFFLNSGLRRKTASLDEFKDEIPGKYMHEMPEMGRSEFCTVWVSYRLPILAETAFFVSKYNNSELRKEVNEIYSDIKEISLTTVRESSWTDSKAKDAVEKVFSKVYFMPESRLPYVTDLLKVDDLYKEVDITEENFLANDLESRKLGAVLFFRNMDNLTKIAQYNTIPFKFYPQYHDPAWAINFELGNLLFPTVTSNRPRYVNLGHFGVIVGHEISHAVEIEIFEESYENKSEVFANALEEKKECFANHYSQYEIYTSGQKIQGNVTFRENLPDYLGILAAFKSLKKYQENHGFEEMLPGLHFNNDQMFFITAAQNWCEAHTAEGLQYYLKDFHSTPHARVLGAFRNLDVFSQAFKCPSGSSMNPSDKCWFE